MTTGKIHNPNGAFGLPTKDSFFREIVEFKTSAAVTAKKAAFLGTDGTVRNAVSGDTASLVIGIFEGSAASGDIAQVVVKGMVEDVPVDGTVSAGSILKRSGTTDGYCAASASPAAGERLAVARNASVSNVADVWVNPGL